MKTMTVTPAEHLELLLAAMDGIKVQGKRPRLVGATQTLVWSGAIIKK